MVAEEIELLAENPLETELDQLVDQRAAEIIALGTVGDVVAQLVKQTDFCARAGFDRENLIVDDGDVAQGVIEQLGELFAVLVVVQIGDECSRLSLALSAASRKISISYCLSEYAGNRLLPFVRLRQFRVDPFHFVAELVVHELVKKRLGDDLEFVAVVAQPVRSAHAFQVVD